MRSRVLPPARLLAVVAPVSIVGVAAYCAATFHFLAHPGSRTEVAGVAAFLLASTLAERYPVPVEGADANGVSLGFVFAVAALVLFGWAPATFVYASAPTIVALVDRRPLIRTVFNAGVFGLVGTIAGLVLTHMHGDNSEAVLAKVAATSAILYAVNIPIVTAAISASGSQLGYWRLIRSNIRWTIVPFALMASTALMLVVLWQRTPFLFAALAGPLVAISLYQRSTHRALTAIRLALTDPLTGLGNHRHFQERLQRELTTAEESGGSVSLCLLDIDDFKQINDRFGHPAGDRVLAHVALRLRQGGESFRLGGDEFAVLLPAVGEQLALATAKSIAERVGSSDAGVGRISISVGVATYPRHAHERDSLIRLADGALYWAKEHGKNQVHLARGDVPQLVPLRTTTPAAVVDLGSRFRAATALAQSVDERDASAGSHSDRVATLAASVATRLGLQAEEVELVRVAAAVHDLGKLAIPEEILGKPAGLSGAERLVVERHPQIGANMLESLGARPVAESVLHHHEWWNGGGYPTGLAGPDIPLASRIIHVVDAYDAMTAERPFRSPLGHHAALSELERGAGTQFDPEVVEAFVLAVGAGLAEAV